MTEKIVFKAKELLFNFRNFPITLISVWLFTVILTFSIDSDNAFWGKALLFLFYYGTGSFLIETLFLNAAKNKWFFAALAADLLPASVFLYLTVVESYRYWDSCMTRYSVCYFLILFLLSLYFCRKKLGCSFPDYLTRVFGRTVRYHIVYLILMVGVGIIAAVAMELFGLDYNLLIRSQMLLLGLYYMSAFLLSFYPEKEETSRLTAALLKYVLSVMVITAYVIIYAYLLKILITREIPSNAIFRITAGLFAAAFPVCLMVSGQPEHTLSRIMRRLPYLFLPFLSLQGYSIGIRIFENGVTPMRYAAVAFLLFECVSLALYHFRPSAMELLLPVGAGILCVAGLFPYVNMNYVSFLNQKSVIDRYLSLPEEQCQALLSGQEEEGTAARIKGAYSYLRGDYLGARYLDSLAEESVALLDGLAENTGVYEAETDRISYGATRYTDRIDISDYSVLYPVDVHEYAYDISSEELADYRESLRHYPLTEGDNAAAYIDLNELFDFYRAHADGDRNFDEYLSQHFTYEISDGYTLSITLLSFTYDESQDAYYPFRVEGYLLGK